MDIYQEELMISLQVQQNSNCFGRSSETRSYLSIVGQKLTQIGTSKAEINFVLEHIYKRFFLKGKELKSQ